MLKLVKTTKNISGLKIEKTLKVWNQNHPRKISNNCYRNIIDDRLVHFFWGLPNNLFMNFIDVDFKFINNWQTRLATPKIQMQTLLKNWILHWILWISQFHDPWHQRKKTTSFWPQRTFLGYHLTHWSLVTNEFLPLQFKSIQCSNLMTNCKLFYKSVQLYLKRKLP